MGDQQSFWGEPEDDTPASAGAFVTPAAADKKKTAPGSESAKTAHARPCKPAQTAKKRTPRQTVLMMVRSQSYAQIMRAIDRWDADDRSQWQGLVDEHVGAGLSEHDAHISAWLDCLSTWLGLRPAEAEWWFRDRSKKGR